MADDSHKACECPLPGGCMADIITDVYFCREPDEDRLTGLLGLDTDGDAGWPDA